MKKVYLPVSMFLLILVGFTSVNAQQFPWPDLGEAKIIEPDPTNPGALNDAIMSDTSATGERLHNHYILKRGATYTYTSRINNNGWPLMVTAEDGDGALPYIQPIKPIGEDEAPRPFHAQGDFYADGLHISGYDTDDIPADNATVRLASDSVTVVLKNVLFDFNRLSAVRVNADACSLYIEGCVFGDQGVAEQMWAGYAVNYRANTWPLAIIRNNTFYNHHNSIISMYGDKTKYGKLIFENNTVVNVGTQGSPLGRPDTLIFKNNLWVNVGILGDAREGDRDDFAHPAYAFSVDTNFTDTTQTEWIDPVIEFTNNHFYNDPAIFEFLPDSSDKMTETFFNPYLADRVDESTTLVLEQAFADFENFPTGNLADYEAYINGFYGFEPVPAQLPNFGMDILEVDFGYPTSHAAFSAAADGGPLGDLTWFGGAVGIVDVKTTSFNIYPNPVQNILHVKLTEDQRIDKVVITNVLGQNVKTVESISGKNIHINTSELRTGLYFINFFNEGTLLGTNKVLKR